MQRIEFISPEDFQKLYRAEKDKEMKLVLMLAFGSGLRISEIVGLKSRISSCCRSPVTLKRVEVGNRKLKKYYCDKCGNLLRFKDLRYAGDDWYIPPLTPEKVNLITHQIRLDTTKGGKWRVTVTPPSLTEEFIKLLPIKTPMRTIQDRFDKLCQEVLGKRLSVHILRHGFGNYQANVLNMPLPVVQSLMGHSRLDTTGIYTKVNPDTAISTVWKAMGEE